ncbi:MAG: hypothetical protein ACK52X_04925, partial [bacterium]
MAVSDETFIGWRELVTQKDSSSQLVKLFGIYCVIMLKTDWFGFLKYFFCFCFLLTNMEVIVGQPLIGTSNIFTHDSVKYLERNTIRDSSFHPMVFNDKFLPSSSRQIDIETSNVLALFDMPDTVCVNSTITITNRSVNATTYRWDFCAANIDQVPTGVLLGNPGNSLGIPVFSDYAFDNGNYYVFVVNNTPGGLIRLNFGNSLLNTPIVTNLGNFNGSIPN